MQTDFWSSGLFRVVSERKGKVVLQEADATAEQARRKSVTTNVGRNTSHQNFVNVGG